MTLENREAELVYQLTKALHLGYDDYAKADPGSIGWHIDNQNFQWVVPFHAGAIRYYREIGKWGSPEDVHNKQLLERQQILARAWQEMRSLATSKPPIFEANELPEIWMQLRAIRLRENSFDPIWE